MQAGEIERYQTIEEIAQLFGVVQAMGHRLAEETHGASYDEVRALNELLHQARMKIEAIQAEYSAFPSRRIQGGSARPIAGFLRK
jgi:hypothetical protein